jgi:L-ascorbate metabolism protein UlaG (beta-lactamase superfamily)
MLVSRAIRGKDGRYSNPWQSPAPNRFLKLIKWLLFSKNAFGAEKKRPFAGFPIERPDFNALDSIGEDYSVWLGHSTVFIRAGGTSLLTDPVFWNVTPFIRRKTPLPVEPVDLPRVDVVLVSHGHYDHLNARSIRFLKDTSDPVFVSAPGYDRFFRSMGTTRHVVLDWFESMDLGGVRITSLPAQHWSKRTVFDTNRHLWCSYLIEHSGYKAYWIGDTGYYEGFREIGEKFGPVDILFVPIGAYEPRWFMEGFHVNPEEALKVARDLNARTIVPIHWGTFDLSDEPLWLPIEHLKEINKEIHDDKAGPELKVLKHGGHLVTGI